MLCLGHIEYSNCFPVHAALLDRGPPPGVTLHSDIPGNLNRALAAGAVDVAPCSSIELARHTPRYRILPGLVIGSDGPVRSIRFESTLALEDLGGATVAVPTASATSVVLLRILLQSRHGVAARLRWFDQARERDPVGAGADAALWIGDRALTRHIPARRRVYDLGAEWTAWTGLPFAFAVWQTPLGPEHDQELAGLHELLLASRAYFFEHAAALAERHAPAFGLPSDTLLTYWLSLRYELDGRMRLGLLEFFRRAAELGLAPPLERLPMVPTSA